MKIMRSCGCDVYRNFVEQQYIRCGYISSSLLNYSNHLDLSSGWHQSSRGSLHKRNRSFVTNLVTSENDTNSPIQGTIPLHGKGLKMGQYAEVHRKFTQEDVNLFGRLSGDMNPVHFPAATIQEEASSTFAIATSNSHKKLPIVHGILLSSLFSNIFGNLIPGAIYRHQSLKFHNAVHVNEDVVGRVIVTKLRQINRKGRGGGNGSGGGVLCTCDTSVIKLDAAALNGDKTTNTDNNNNHDGSNEVKEIVCVSGDAQVWLPDLQLVYECREKGE